MPAEIVEFATDEPEVALRTLSQMYCLDRPAVFVEPPRELYFSIRSVRCGGLHSARVQLRAAAVSHTSPVDDFVAATVLEGAMQLNTGQRNMRVGAGDVVRFSNEQPMHASWTDVTLAPIQVPMQVVRRVAVEHFRGSSDVSFTSMEPINSAGNDRWRALTAFVFRSLRTLDENTEHPILIKHLVELVAINALLVFPNTSLPGKSQRCAERVGSAAFRRAVNFIEANAQEPITITDVADAAGLTSRAVQAAFRRNLSMTPMAYLRRVRLLAVREELIKADPAEGVKVRSVASRWGFGQAARFTDFYEAEFGELPSETLRRT